MRRTLAAFLALQLVIFELAIFTRSRFENAPAGRLLIAVSVALVYLIAIASLGSRSIRNRTLRFFSVLAAILLSLRFYSPAVFRALYPADVPTEKMAATTAPGLTMFLRQLAFAQEQYRLREHSYATDMSPFASSIARPPGSIDILARGDTGWSAHIRHGDTTCSIWVRDTRQRPHGFDVEGSPACGDAPELREKQQRIHTALVLSVPEIGFSASDIYGEWLQHRADARRSGVIAQAVDTSGYTWTTSIGGPLRSSVAIAGKQVFVGSHANGEIVALSLDKGKLGYRIRAPNWIHHEPVVTRDLVIFGFGNNEPSNVDPAFVGSPPSGIVAFDRRTGVERWHRYTAASVMGSPVILDSIVAVTTGGREAIAWRISDGRPLWRVPMAEQAPMANPVLTDSVMLVGIEPAELCAISIRTGHKKYCRQLDQDGKGAGHSSSAIAGELVLQVYEEDLDGSSGRPEGKGMAVIRRIVGLPPQRFHPRPANALREQVLVALRVQDGREVWRTRLGPGRTAAPGHNAGTPVVAGSIAYVPSPVSQSISAVDVARGRLIWSAKVKPARGSVLVAGTSLVAATTDSAFVVLDAATGKVRCRQNLPQAADRAGPTVSGGTAILTLTGGVVLARPLKALLACEA